MRKHSSSKHHGKWEVNPHLEGQAYAAGVLPEAFQVRLPGSAHDGPTDHAGLQQRRRLVLVDVLQRVDAHLQSPPHHEHTAPCMGLV